MAEARGRDAWYRTSSLMALIANCHRDPKKTRRYKASQFDPFREPEIPIKAKIGVLKDVFIDKKVPR